MDRLLASFAPHMLSVLRITAALTFLSHGTVKLLGFPDVGRPGPGMFALSWFAGVLELLGGLMLLLGVFTRPVAFVLSGMMAFAYFISHWPRGITPISNGGEAAYLFCFLFLYIACAGGGPWSLDSMRGWASGGDAAKR